jgi:thymidylate kinase
MRIIAVDGPRGSGKTTLVKQLSEELNLPFLSFPSIPLKDPKRVQSVDWNDIDSVMKYNMEFYNDFVSVNSTLRLSNRIYLCDRYILSNLTHYHFDMAENGFSNAWLFVSKVMYMLYNNGLVAKPICQIYLTGNTNQPVPKFDDNKYKNQETAIKGYYDLEIDAIQNYCGIKTNRVLSYHSGNNALEECKTLISSLI